MYKLTRFRNRALGAGNLNFRILGEMMSQTMMDTRDREKIRVNLRLSEEK